MKWLRTVNAKWGEWGLTFLRDVSGTQTLSRTKGGEGHYGRYLVGR